MTRASVIALLCTVCAACSGQPPAPKPMNGVKAYLDNSGRDDVLTGGVKMIPISTPKGTFKVWTKRTGNNPTVKVLLLHGGPGATHEYMEAFDSYFPPASIEYYYYDQLGSAFSDQPDDPSLWDLARFVEEVEQVRTALRLDRDNFYLLGQSWGGLLAIEYALKYQEHLKGLVVSNMMASIPQYNDYTARAQLSEAVNLAGGLKTPIAEAYSQDASAASCVIPANSVTTGKYVASVAVANAAADKCDVVATMKAAGVQSKVVSKTVTMSYVPSTGAWTCTSDAASEVKPKACS